MKNYKLLTLTLCFAASTLFAQTADDYVTSGRMCLADHDLTCAYSNFNAAVTASPTNETANALLAVTRLLVLPQQPAGSNFLNSLGFSANGRNIYNWTSTPPRDINGEITLPTNNTSVAIAFYRTNIILALGASLTNLSRITDPTFTLSLTHDETSVEAVTVDYGDFQLMQAELYAAEFLGYTLNAQNCNVVLRQLQLLSETNGFSIQTVLADYPSLLTQNNAADLANSRAALTNAIMFYLAASDFIRNTRTPGQGLFLLDDPKTIAEEAVFRDSLTNVLLSVNGPVQLNPNMPVSLDLSNYFAGTKTLRSLLPQFSGSRYVVNTLPDYTFGGILLGEPACNTEVLLRRHIGQNFSGIYTGQTYDNTFFDPNAGSFAIIVNSSQQATVVGDDADQEPAGIFAQFNLDQYGNCQFTSNNVTGSGSFSTDGSFWIELDYTNGVSVYLAGYQQSPYGSVQNGAGYYGGSYSGSDSGTLKSVLGADGEVFICSFTSGVADDGGYGQIDSTNQFAGYTDNSGTAFGGTYNPSTFTIAGHYTNTDNSTGSFTVSRSANVDLPPLITVPPTNQTVGAGVNATFSVTATGSQPLYYQWYCNGVAINQATNSSLVVSNAPLSASGNDYAVAVRNVVGNTIGEADADAILNVGDTNKPVLGITNVTAGLQVSNAEFIVKGWATDNVAVASVYFQLNTSGWSNATSFNGSNWTAAVTLLPGTNTISAYAVDTSGNVSVTNTVSNFVYIVSAPLTVTTNGLGTLNPNDNGVPLQVGKSYSITATAASGFTFINWTGGTSLPLSWLTNGATVSFLMQSNLMLQANFLDTTKPTLSITNLTAGQRITTAGFTVKGTAGDNWQVSNVLCQINGGGWNSATNFNSWTNWAAGVTLVPGTNLVQAYAVDTSGNFSVTSSVSCQFVVTNLLAVRTNGLGSYSPTNLQLEVGRNYSITATPASGFVATNWIISTNWSDGVKTNNATVQFMMASNLTLLVTFADITKPTLSITNLTAGQRVSNAVFTVKGTAGDNWQVSNVLCQVNGGGWNSATNLNNWTNWAAGVTLVPGTNAVQAYALDTSGNFSVTSSVSFQYVVTNQLGVRALGLGTINPNYSNAWLEVGRNYSIVGAPASGFVATNWIISTNWIGGVKTNSPTVQFMMASNLTLLVTFADVTKPMLTVSSPTAGQRMTNALANVTGTASDNWQVAGVWCQLNSNGWVLVTTTNTYTNWSQTLTLAAGTNTIKAYAVDLGGNYSATNTLSVISSNTFQLQLKFTAALPLTSTGLNFSLLVSSNLNGHIQVSSNLVNWLTLTNFVGTNTTLNFRDPTATNSNRRFYRAVIP